MNKIKQNLYQKLQGQLSSEKIKLDIDNAYSVVKESVLSFNSFLRENYHSDFETWSSNRLPIGFYQDRKSYDIISIEDIFKIFENEK